MGGGRQINSGGKILAMVNISMKTMLEAGVHFGHQTWRWNPKMGRFIFGERNNIHIIDLQKTVKEIKKVNAFVKDCAAQDMTFLFVGTKKQARELIKAEAERCGAAYVSEKWLGGTLTNFATLRKSVQRLEELEKWERDGLFTVLSKKEVSRLNKEMLRLKKVLTGIRVLNRPPDVMFIIDPVEEHLAVQEARRMEIPIVAVCDTDSNPDLIDHPIPGNDDAARSIKLFCGFIADSILEGRSSRQAEQPTLGDAEKQMLSGEESSEPTEEVAAASSSTQEA